MHWRDGSRRWCTCAQNSSRPVGLKCLISCGFLLFLNFDLTFEFLGQLAPPTVPKVAYPSPTVPSRRLSALLFPVPCSLVANNLKAQSFSHVSPPGTRRRSDAVDVMNLLRRRGVLRRWRVVSLGSGHLKWAEECGSEGSSNGKAQSLLGTSTV